MTIFGGEGDLYVSFNGKSIEYHTTINCPTKKSCKIICNGHRGCASIQVYNGSNASVYIEANGIASLEKANIEIPYAKNFTAKLTAENTADRAYFFVTFVSNVYIYSTGPRGMADSGK